MKINAQIQAQQDSRDSDNMLRARDTSYVFSAYFGAYHTRSDSYSGGGIFIYKMLAIKIFRHIIIIEGS